MACCGGGRSGRRRRPPVPTVSGTEKILMAYVGPREELFTTRGPATGIKYLTSALEHERLVPVFVEDQPGLEASGVWVVVGE